MQQAQGQFTPEQMIVAGRRAEAQGQPAYALQFYRYIAESFPNSTEAYEARDALYRLQPPVADPHAQSLAMGAPAAGAQPAYSTAPGQPVASMTDVRPSASLESGGAASRPAEGRKRRKAAETADVEVDDAPSYRAGRLVAVILASMGWLMIISAALMAPLAAVALLVKAVPKGIREAVAGNLLAVGASTFGLLFLGLMAVFAAQVARATFDTADALKAAWQRQSADQ